MKRIKRPWTLEMLSHNLRVIGLVSFLWQAVIGTAADMTADQVRELIAKTDSGVAAQLAGKDLSGLDLSRIDFKRANLAKANLFGSKLVLANLSNANLAGANLNGAWLMGTDFRGADLSNGMLMSLVIVG